MPRTLWVVGGHLLALLLVMAAIWLPELLHWYVRPQLPSVEALSRARAEPTDALLQEIGSLQLRGVPVAADQVVARAQEVERGVLSLPGFPPASIGLPFDPADLERGSPTWRLMFASLASADLLLDGYQATGRQAWLDLAERVIVGFARHEASRWLDEGLMWNDHATAARMAVLVKFWRLHRSQGEPSPATTQAVLHLVARSALLLMKADAYAWRTSHGILSDLALLQMAAAFPSLPEATEARRVAWSRLQGHLKYWINAEGATLLHSAGYHSGSLYHLSAALRLLTLNSLAIPTDWWTRYDRALKLESLLRRPDGSLPLVGDTANISEALPPMVTARGPDDKAQPLQPHVPLTVTDAAVWLPAAGHAVWRDTPHDSTAERGSQTVMTWSYYPGLGHKLADELSVVLWSQGQTWITNTGYWPYGSWGREQAESWTTSNAPHLVGESKDSLRDSTIVSNGQSDGLRFVEAQRLGPDGFSARRQLLRLSDADAWLVIDHMADPKGRPTLTAWTLAPDLTVATTNNPTRFVASAPLDRGAASITLAGPPGATLTTHQGQRSPLLGWVVVERSPQPAPSLVMQQPITKGTWGLASVAWTPDVRAAQDLAAATMQDWRDPEHWTAKLETRLGSLQVQRIGRSIEVVGAQRLRLNLQAADTGASQRAEAVDAYAAAARTYSKFPELVFYRTRVTQALLLAFLVQTSFLIIWRRRQAVRWMHGGLWVAWLAGGAWLNMVYLAG